MVLRKIETDGGTLAVEVQGEGPLIVCAPGMGDTRDSYGPLATQLVSHGFRVATIDPRGHGDSTTGFARYGDAAMADDFISVIQTLNDDGSPALLAGVSFSAGAAVMAAGQRPELVAGVVLLGPFLRNPAGAVVTRLVHAMFWRPWGPWMWQTYAKGLWPGLGEKGSAERAAASKAGMTRPGRWAAFQATVAGANHSLVGPWIARVRAPVLVVMGDKDPDWSDPVAEAKWVASNFDPVETIIVPGVGHAPQLEKPDVVEKGMLKMLEDVQSRGGFKKSA